jgi:hypothetical protein
MESYLRQSSSSARNYHDIAWTNVTFGRLRVSSAPSRFATRRGMTLASAGTFYAFGPRLVFR